jgi:RNA polymerase sigma factor (sigma-70 family)
MSSDDSFCVLISQVRAGNQAAASALVQQYEPEIRRLIRLRLTDPRLRRVLDSVDICQSVMANFFVRAAAGQFELDRPEQLLKLLATMVRNRLVNHVHHQQAARRDLRRLQGGGAEALDAVADRGTTASHIVGGKELLQEVRRQLTEQERYLADQRAQGRDWAEIAAELGESAEALRKRLARALDRITRRLGFDEL